MKAGEFDGRGVKKRQFVTKFNCLNPNSHNYLNLPNQTVIMLIMQIKKITVQTSRSVEQQVNLI